MALIQNGTIVGDGSWILAIHVTDMKVERSLRVTGDMHIGGLMLRLVEELDVTRDWSDHALWWPARRKWLTHTRSTLDQMRVTAEMVLEFTPMHKVARVQLPDLQSVDARLDFSVPVFNATVQLCKELGIRHPEELSLKRYIPPDQLRKGLGFEADALTLRQQQPSPRGHPQQNLSQSAHNISQPQNASPVNYNTIDGHPLSPVHSPVMSPGHGSHPNGVLGPPLTSLNWGEGLSAEQFDQRLVHSPRTPPKGAFQSMLRPKNLEQKAALNRGWLNSSLSLMEQGIFEADLVLLRFKYMAFFDLNPKYDPVRLNQLFEQAKWSVLCEEMDSTDEEAMMFAALQLQVNVQSGAPEKRPEEGDDVDLMLNDLEQTLAGVSTQSPDLMKVPELAEYLRYFKPKKLTLKGWKRAFFTFRDLYLSWYPSAHEAQGPPLGRFCLKGCEVTPDVNIGQRKFCIKLLIPSAEGMTEFILKCDSEQQYARFLAGCRLASRGKTMADASFVPEVDSIRRLLDMQQVEGTPPPPSTTNYPVPGDLQPEEYLPQRAIRKIKTRQQVVQRILEAHSKVKGLSCTDAKMQYIRAWQALPEHGIHYFVVRLRGSRKPELVGIAYNRMMKMNLDTGDSIKTWRFSQMKKWHVNWEIKHVLVQYEEENVEFRCLSADCKVPHEFIGGYIFLTMRNKEKNQTLDIDRFHQLTCGWM